MGNENIEKAYKLRDRVSELEKFRISSQYLSVVLGDIEKASQQYQLWAQSYPRDGSPHLNLSNDYASEGQYEKALPEIQEALRLDPSYLVSYGSLATTFLALNRLDEAKATLEQAQVRKLDGRSLRVPMYYLAFLRNDAEGMKQQVGWASGKAGDEAELLSAQSDTEAYRGRLSMARDLSRRAVQAARAAGSNEAAATWEADAALREAEFGNVTEAKQAVASALALAQEEM